VERKVRGKEGFLPFDERTLGKGVPEKKRKNAGGLEPASRRFERGRGVGVKTPQKRNTPTLSS